MLRARFRLLQHNAATGGTPAAQGIRLEPTKLQRTLVAGMFRGSKIWEQNRSPAPRSPHSTNIGQVISDSTRAEVENSSFQPREKAASVRAASAACEAIGDHWSMIR